MQVFTFDECKKKVLAKFIFSYHTMEIRYCFKYYGNDEVKRSGILMWKILSWHFKMLQIQGDKMNTCE